MTTTATFTDVDPDDVMDLFADVGGVCAVVGNEVTVYLPEGLSRNNGEALLAGAGLPDPTWSDEGDEDL